VRGEEDRGKKQAGGGGEREGVGGDKGDRG